MLEMEEKFKNGVSIKNGQKYIGIYTSSGHQSSIWGGVAKKDSACGRVKKGDILNAAGYGAYTLVGAGRRGNVLEGNFSVSWTVLTIYREVNMWLYVIGLFTLCLGIGIESLSISFGFIFWFNDYDRWGCLYGHNKE